MPVIRQRQSKAYKDISLSFKRHPVTNDILALTNEDAMEIIQDLSEAYYNTGRPDPSTITMELSNGENEAITNG